MHRLLPNGLAVVLVFSFSDVLAIQDDADVENEYQRESYVTEEGGGSGWSGATGWLGDPGPAGDIFAADEFFPGLMCGECRDPGTYPVDFAAFSFNAYFGESAWGWGMQLGIPFRVYNLAGDWAVVWFKHVFMERYSFLPDTIIIVVRLRTGEILRVEVLEQGPDMPIGYLGPNTSGDSGGDDGDDYDDLNDDDSGDMEIDEHTGTVEIEDPDEDGKFEDWLEEL